MIKALIRAVYIFAFLFVSALLASCGSGGGGGAGTGTLELRLTDASGDYQNVFVTIKEIQVHQAAGDVDGEDPGWRSVLTFTPGETFDLTTLEDGQIIDLGVAELEAGKYNQMRLILAGEPVESHPYANYVVIEGEQEEEYIIGEQGVFYTIEELKIPSGFQTGVKIVKGFEIVADSATALILDFDAQKSVVKAGKSGQWLLKPTIKILDTVSNSISGEVNEGVNEFLENAQVSAQVYTPPPSEPPLDGWDLKDEVMVIGSDNTDLLGDYKIYLAPETYNVVATMQGYLPRCQIVAAEPGYFDYPDNNFTLTSTDTGTVAGEITGFAEEDEFVTLSFRQTLVCGDGEVKVEVLSKDVAVKFDNTYEISLPVGDYQLIVSSENNPTLEIPIVSVAADTETPLSISF